MVNRAEKFIEVYREILEKDMAQNPTVYRWHKEQINDYMGRFRNALPKGGFQISPAIKKTCKILGIGSTYKAIQGYIDGNHNTRVY